MIYTDTVGLVGWLDGGVGLDGWVYPWGDGSVWTGMGWNGGLWVDDSAFVC